MAETVVIYDQRMHALISEEATLQKLAEGADHSEGPVYMPNDDSVIWSDVSGNRLYSWSRSKGVSVIKSHLTIKTVTVEI